MENQLSNYTKKLLKPWPVEILQVVDLHDLPSYKMVDLSLVFCMFTRGCIYHPGNSIRHFWGKLYLVGG